MIVNEQKIEIYDLDTFETVKMRIASLLNTTPNYIINFDKDFRNNERMKVIDVLSEIKQNTNSARPDIQSLIDAYQDKKYEFNIIRDIIYPWITFNKHLDDVKISLLQQLQNLGKGFTEDFENFIDNKANTYKVFLETLIQKNKRENQTNEQLFGKLQTLKK